MTSKDVKVKKSGGKKKQSTKLKNILAYPFPQYWPALTTDQTTELKSHIQNLKEDPNVKLTVENVIPIIGLGKILREINRNQEIYFVLSTDIKPKFVATQIINLTLSKFKLCKVLCIPNLKDLTKSLFGIESIAFGYKLGQCPPVEKWIKDAQEKYFPVPKEILTYYSKGICETDNTQPIIQLPKSKTMDKVNTNSLYLRRNTDERAFIPTNAENIRRSRFDESERESTEWSDFISLSMKSTSKPQPMSVDEDSDDCEVEKQRLANTIVQAFAKRANGNMRDSSMTFKEEVQAGGRKSKENFQKTKLHENHEKHKKSSKFNYIGLTVNRIQPNPDKVKKKKKQ